MKKDIQFPKVENVYMAIVREKSGKEYEWRVYVINEKPEEIYGVLVTSKGYGKIENREVNTSTLRHFLDTIPGNSYCMVELIMDDLFQLNNEYWLSFYHQAKLYDKKFVFVNGSINTELLTKVPVIEKEGILIK